MRFNYQNMKIYSLIMFGILFIGVAATFSESNADVSQDNLKFDPNYPGIASDGSKITDIAMGMVQLGLQYYYKVYGAWPSSWSEVVDSGIYQVPLVGYKLQTIDPDDNSLDFDGDLVYDPHVRDDGSIVVNQSLGIDGVVVKQFVVNAPATYSEILPALQQLDPSDDIESLFNNVDWLRQFAVLGMINHGLYLHQDLDGQYPFEVQNLIDRGLAPIDRMSINPLTGSVYRFDGSEFDIYYERCGEDRKNLLHVGENGRLPRIRFTY